MSTNSDGDGWARLRVLVADDNADGAESLALLLRMRGHDLRVATDGPAALREAEAGQPDVVILDLGLPGLDGYEVARRLRQRELEALRREPPLLIGVADHPDDETDRRATLAGIDLHLTSPVNHDLLQDILLRFAKSSHPADTPAQAGPKRRGKPAAHQPRGRRARPSPREPVAELLPQAGLGG
jgi:CheY-like chemotaxis protein